MTLEISSLFTSVFVIFLILLLLKYLFPPKPRSTKKLSSQQIKYNIRLRFFFLSLVSILLIIAFLYYYGLEFIKILQRVFLHFSKTPLIIETENAYAFVTLIFLFIISNYFLVVLPLKKYLGTNYESTLHELSLKIGFDVVSILKITNVIFGIVWIIVFCLFIWSFDYYVVANDDGIYYNPVENFWKSSFYTWDEVDKIFYITYTENNGTTYKQTNPYYQIEMRNNQLIELSGKTLEVEQWISLIKNRSQAIVYEKRGNRLLHEKTLSNTTTPSYT